MKLEWIYSDEYEGYSCKTNIGEWFIWKYKNTRTWFLEFWVKPEKHEVDIWKIDDISPHKSLEEAQAQAEILYKER